MSLNKVVVALGSNIEPERYMSTAVNCLSAEFDVLAKSRFVVTKPLGTVAQPDFMNGVVLLATTLEREPLRSRLKDLEVSLGRQKRTDKWGPREIDLDILLWNGVVVNKDFYERDFLRQSVAEILPVITGRCY